MIDPRHPRACPGCGSERVSLFYHLEKVPVNSVLLVDTREEALAFPRGEIDLGFCGACGFVSNYAFDPARTEYSPRCEETQGYSPTFTAFHRELARTLIERYDLRGRDIVEIGCGKGEFLALLCELGANRGIGFDPAFVPERAPRVSRGEVSFIQDFYSEKYTGYRADFVCCKMTLEHIPDTARFMATVRRSIGDRRETMVFFQIPDFGRILREVVFWDVYYEHCSYFTCASLRELFRRSGFEVLSTWTAYGDQYLMIEARPAEGPAGAPADGTRPATDAAPSPPSLPDTPAEVRAMERQVRLFGEQVRRRLDDWRAFLRARSREGRRVVLWGSGSKAVSFLTALQGAGGVEYVVDINPYRHGTYTLGTGQPIVAPEFLRDYRPDLVVVMNGIYLAEIGRSLRRLGVEARLVSVDAGAPAGGGASGPQVPASGRDADASGPEAAV
jgi:SAM-dependent methyltransferase